MITPSSRESRDSALESLHSKPEIFVICAIWKANLYRLLSHLRQSPVFAFFRLFRRSLDAAELGCLPPALRHFRKISDAVLCEIVLARTAPMSLMSVCSSVDLRLLSPQACSSLVRASAGGAVLALTACSRECCQPPGEGERRLMTGRLSLVLLWSLLLSLFSKLWR